MWATWRQDVGYMGQPRAKTGAQLRPNRAYIGQQQQHQQQPQQQQPPPQPRAKTGANLRPNTTTTTTTTTTTPARADGSAFAGARLSGVSLINPARGPLAVALPYGSSLLSVGERGAAQESRYRQKPPRLPCFVLFPFFPIFRILWFKMGQHGPT